MKNRLVSRIVAAAVVLAGAACLQTEELGSIHVKSQQVRAAQGGGITVSAQESPELAGIALTIPAAALAADTEITVGLQRKDIVPAEALAAGPVAVFGPSGTRFSTPATLELPYRLPEGQSAAGLFVLVLEDDGTTLRIEPPALVVDAAAGKVRFPVSGLARFQPGARQDPACRGVVCQSGETCVDGQCVQAECGAEVCGNGGDDDCDSQVDEGCASGCSTDAGCPGGEVCQSGECVAIGCAGVTCAEGERCVQGDCQPADPCAGVICASGETCVDGRCVQLECVAEVCGNGIDDDCDGENDEGCAVSCGDSAVICATGEVCYDGRCTIGCTMDVDCPSGQVCDQGYCA